MDLNRMIEEKKREGVKSWRIEYLGRKSSDLYAACAACDVECEEVYMSRFANMMLRIGDDSVRTYRLTVKSLPKSTTRSLQE
jgi:hypothetical protein